MNQKKVSIKLHEKKIVEKVKNLKKSRNTAISDQRIRGKQHSQQELMPLSIPNLLTTTDNNTPDITNIILQT